MKRFSDLERQYVLEAIDGEFATSRNSIFNSRLEREFAERFGSRFAIGFVNGTATLHTALAALGVGPGDEVIVPPLTMSSTAMSVLQAGAIAVFADVDRDAFTLDPKSVEAKLSERTKAIMSVALYGLSPDYDGLLRIRRERGIPLVEDNAQSFLSEFQGALVGRQGDFASFSFQASKHLTAGEGGMLITDDEELANKARRFSSLGYAGVSAKQGKITRNDIQDPQYNRHVALGFNYRMSEVNAAVLLGQLQRAEELVAQRIKVARIFDEALAGQSLLRRQAEPDGCRNTYWAYSVVLDTPDPGRDWYRFRDLFQAKGGDGYYAAWKLSYLEPLFLDQIQHMPGVRQTYGAGLCPNAEYLQPRMIQLKTNYWDLGEAEVQARILKETIQAFRPK
jgi:perosamine synthetase